MAHHLRTIATRQLTETWQSDDPARLRAAIVEEADPARVMRRVADALLVLIEQAEGSMVELADHRGHMVYICGSGSLQAFEGLEIPLEGSLSGLAVRAGTALQCDDSESDPRVDRVACRRVGARSMICVPLERRQETVGVLKVSSGQPSAFSAADLEVLKALAEFVAAAIGAAEDLGHASATALAGAGMGTPATIDRSLAMFVADVLRPGVTDSVAARDRIERALADRQFTTVFQPIVDLAARAVVGVEALTRFQAEPVRGPDKWFAEAHSVGRGVDLELAAAETALAQLAEVPGSIYMSVNASPEVLATDDFVSLCTAGHPERVVVELTEHVAVEDYPMLLTRLEHLRSRGVRLAIDDTGAGISSLAHILALSPSIIKLDRSLVSGIDTDPVRRSLARALVAFGSEIAAHVVAEGVETEGELASLQGLGVTLAQGYQVARPAPLPLLRSWLGRSLPAPALRLSASAIPAPLDGRGGTRSRSG